MKISRLAAAALLSAGMSQAYAQDKVAKIGLMAPITGGAAADGQEMVKGAQLAIDEINASGGVAGYKLELVVGDIQGATPDIVTSVVERLSSDRDLNAILVGYASTTNFEIDLMAEMDMPYLIAGNSAETVRIISRDPAAYPTVWSMVPSYDAFNTELVPVVDGLAGSGKFDAGDKKVALISSDNPYSKTIMEGLAGAFTADGWTVTSKDLLPFGEINDWRPFLAKVRNDKPSVIVNTDYVTSNAATFLTQFLEQPTKSLVFIQYAPSVPEFMELTKDKSTGVLFNTLGGIVGMSDRNERTAKYTAMFKDKYGADSGVYGALLYEEVHVYADALAKVGDPAKRIEIGNAIGGTDKQIATGHLKFDPATHLAVQGAEGIPIQFYQIWDGKQVLFYPASVANGEFQTPPWIK